MANDGKRSWFKKTFGRSSTPDPAKQRYEDKLREVTPFIQQASQVSGEYKKAMATGLKEAQQLAKDKRYDEATERLATLGQTAQSALKPSLSSAPNAPQLRVAAQRLQQALSKAAKEKVVLLHPNLELVQATILGHIEQLDDVKALQALDTLDQRISDVVTNRGLAQAEVQRVEKALKTHGITLPPDLAQSLDGLHGAASMGQIVQVTNLVGRIDDYVNRAVKVKQDLDLARNQAVNGHLGTLAEIQDEVKKVTDALDKGDVGRAENALKAMLKWVGERELRVEALEDGLADVRDSVETHKLQLVPPATLDGGEQAVRSQMIQGELHKAELALGKHKAALGAAAELLRLSQVLQRLLDEEKLEQRLDPQWLGTQGQRARQLIDAGQVKEAQVEIKRIQEAIGGHESELEPDEREAVELQRAQRRLDNRLKRVREMAQLDTSPAMQRCLSELEKIQPPLDRVKLAQAAELYTQATLLSKRGRLEGKGGSANSVLTLKTQDRLDKGTKYKQFFKPVSGESSQPGFPKGGGASREVLGKNIADKMVALTGLPIQVAETHLIELPQELLPPDLAKKGPAVGSLQHNVHHKGDAQQRPMSDLRPEDLKQLYAKIPKKQVQAKQIYDLVFLNMDVHQGNIFVKGDDDTAQLDGIDNGMGMPSKEGLLLRAEAFGQHALSGYPGNQDKFDPDMLDAIDKLDDQVLAKTARDSFADMKKRFPNSEATQDDKLGDEHIEVMAASVRFLKKAAKELTVNELQNAYLVATQEIFGIGDSDLSEEERFQAAIDAAKERGKALEECLANEKAIMQVANTNKWLVPPMYQRGPIIQQTLLKFYPQQYVAIWKANGPMGPLGQTPPVPPIVPLDQFSTAEVQDFTQREGRAPLDSDAKTMSYRRAYAQLGGDAAAQRLGAALSASPAYSLAEQRYNLLWQLTEIRKAMAGVPV